MRLTGALLTDDKDDIANGSKGSPPDTVMLELRLSSVVVMVTAGVLDRSPRSSRESTWDDMVSQTLEKEHMQNSVMLAELVTRRYQ